MRTRLAILSVVLLAACGGLVAAHARWLVAAKRDARMVNFLRRYDRRATEGLLPPHGTATDRRGLELDIAAPGSQLQRVIDDIQLETGAPAALTIDGALQAKGEELMAGKTGAAVVIEPSTGRVRALVSAPRAAGLNRALNGLYPPGSTFKIFIAGAALSAGLDPVFNCPAAGWRPNASSPAIRDVEAAEAARRGRAWKGFGRLGMAAALARSSNTYFAQLGAALGTERFDAAAYAAKLREPATLLASRATALTAAACGVSEGAPPAALAPVALGQGELALSPLAVALVTCAVANDGVLLEPTLSPDARPALRGRPFTFAAAGRVKKMMRGAVRSGTGRMCDIPGLDVCGKTGTAQTGRGRDHAWFTCFAPEKNPRLVVTVLVENGGFGAAAALPVARALLLAAREEGWFE